MYKMYQGTIKWQRKMCALNLVYILYLMSDIFLARLSPLAFLISAPPIATRSRNESGRCGSVRVRHLPEAHVLITYRNIIFKLILHCMCIWRTCETYYSPMKWFVIQKIKNWKNIDYILLTSIDIEEWTCKKRILRILYLKLSWSNTDWSVLSQLLAKSLKCFLLVALNKAFSVIPFKIRKLLYRWLHPKLYVEELTILKTM